METVRDYAAAGILPAVRLSSRTLRFRVADVEAFIDPAKPEAGRA
jgi:hypothetical protein